MTAFISSAAVSFNRYQVQPLSKYKCGIKHNTIQTTGKKTNGHNTRSATMPSMVAVRGSSKNPYRIAVLPGDGAGPVVANAVKKILSALAGDADLHFEFINAPYGQEALQKDGTLVPDETIEICKSSDAVLRSYQGIRRGETSTLAHLELIKKLEIYAQFRPYIIYPKLAKLSTIKEDVVKNLDIMLVREISAGAISLENSNKEETKSIIEYTENQIKNIADMAIKIAEKRSGKILNIDKADVMSVSKFWRRIINDTILSYKHGTNDGIVLNNMFVDDFVREIIYNPNLFDVVVTSNLFGDIVAEVIDALVGPQRFSPTFWKAKSDLGIYGPADIYNLQAYPSTNFNDIGLGPNAIALTRAASMMLRYELDEPAAANTIQQALRKTMADFADDISKSSLNDSERLLIKNNAADLVAGTADSNRINGNGNGSSNGSVNVDQQLVATEAKRLVSAFSNTSADEYADVLVRSMTLLRQFEQVCDPTECGE